MSRKYKQEENFDDLKKQATNVRKSRNFFLSRIAKINEYQK